MKTHPTHSASSGTTIVLVFVLAVFVSATLLFLIQPMMAKWLLPSFGGAASVWNTCLVFYQGVLLLGYFYAHGTARLPLSRQVAIHLGLMGVVFLLLLKGLPELAAPEADANPALSVLWRLSITIGLPFLCLAGTGTLLQAWFARSGHAAASDPYFLYAASNLGSMVALLGYPALFEPRYGLSDQVHFWTLGFVLLLGCVFAGGMLAIKGDGGSEATSRAEAATPVSTAQRLAWVGYAFVPSSLMMGVTLYITTDITPVPLLWVVPLALYLLGFIIAFARIPTWVLTASGRVLLPFLFLLLFFLISGIRYPTWAAMSLNLGVFFLVAVVFHGRLAAMRPEAKHLTEFYLWLSVGGVAGGIFNALIAPVAFDTLIEYPLVLIVAAIALRPAMGEGWQMPQLPEGTNTLSLVGAIVTLAGLFCPWLGATTELPIYGATLPAGLPLALAALVVAYSATRSEGNRERDWSVVTMCGGIVMLGVVLVTTLSGAMYVYLSGGDLYAGEIKWLLAAPSWGLAVPFLGGMLCLGGPFFARGKTQSYEGPVIDLLLGAALTLGSSWLITSWYLGIGVDLTHWGEAFEKLTARMGVEDVEMPRWRMTSVVSYSIPIVVATVLMGFRRSVAFALVMISFLAIVRADDDDTRNVIYRERTFYGALAVENSDDGQCRYLMNGTTPHGRQFLDPEFAHVPLSFYHRSGPVGDIMQEIEGTDLKAHFGVVGLGTGTLSAYGEKGEKVTFYELNPSVLRIAENPEYFTYLQVAQAEVETKLGDARLRLDEEESGTFGLILVDAFSSDAIPIHLITREAIDLYFDKLLPDGILAIHVSNRYLSLAPVVARVAQEAGYAIRVQNWFGRDGCSTFSTEWVMLVRDPYGACAVGCGGDPPLDDGLPTVCNFGELLCSEYWEEIEVADDVPLWTDDFSDLYSVLELENTW